MVTGALFARLRPRMRGFTTVELMVVVLIVAILMAFAAPAMTRMVRNQRVKTAAFDVFATLTFARSEAVKRNVTVSVTPNDTSDWTKGWVVADANGNVLKTENDRKLGASELILTGPTAAVMYSRTGRLGSAAPKFNMKTSDAQSIVRCVSVDLSGRPVSQEALCP